MQKEFRRIGLYGGSFDPIHNGHLILAREAAEQLELDLVLLIPANVSPHKTHSPPAESEGRLAVLRAAVEDEPLFQIEECELRREGFSFTVDTVAEMALRYPTATMFLFVGEDQLPALHTWREMDRIRSMVKMVVLSRGLEDAKVGEYFVQRRIDISSTDIRNRVARGLSIRYLLPEKAEHMIQSLHLYVG